MLLDHWLIGDDARLDLRYVTRRWMTRLAADPMLGRIQPWEQLYHTVMLALAEFLEEAAVEPETLPLVPDEAGAVWAELRGADPQGFDRSLYYLQEALQEYLQQSTKALGRVEAFFATLLNRLDGQTGLPAAGACSTDLLLDDVARHRLPSLNEVARAAVQAATHGSLWQDAALYWWDRRHEVYRRLAATPDAVALDDAYGRLLHEWSPLQPEAQVHVQLPSLHLWQPLLHGQGLLSLSRQARTPVQPSERETLIRFAAQIELLLIQAADKARSQADRRRLSHQVVALATSNAEMALVQDIFALARGTSDPDRFGQELLDRLGRAMVAEQGALWLVDEARGRLRCRHAVGDVGKPAWRPLPGEVPLPRLAESPLDPVGTVQGHWLLLPLKTADRWIGTIELSRPFGMAPFTEVDLGLAETLGAYIAPLVQIQRLQDQLADHAQQDLLTGLPGPARMQVLLATAVADAVAEAAPVSVILAAVDPLPPLIEDQTGLDRQLRRVAASIEACLAPSDTLGRWDETSFLILLPGRDALAAGDLLVALYRACYRFGEAGASLVSLGLATGCGEAADPQILLDDAQVSLAQAKVNRDQLRLALYWEQDDEATHRP